MRIANRKIGLGNDPLIIAELGINHGGNFALAEKMVKIAAENSCEAIKHQAMT